MNGGFKPWDELVAAAATLDMAWVTKDHPADGWVYSRDEGIGFCRNTKCDEKNKRLTTELAIFDTEENERWIKAVEMDIKNENSVGFTCKMELPPEMADIDEDTLIEAYFNGTYEELLPTWEDPEYGSRAYDHIQSNIFFNHDAILDAGDGACGGDYGCSVGAEAGDIQEEKMGDEELKKLSDCQEAIANAEKRHEELADAVAKILDYIKANEVSTEDEDTEDEESEEEAEEEEDEPATEEEPTEEEEEAEDEDEEDEEAEPEEATDSEQVPVEVRIPGADSKPKNATSASDRLRHTSIGGRQPDGSYPGEKRYTKE